MSGTHITIIAGEKESVKPIKDPFLSEDIIEGITVNFSYENVVFTNGRAFWLDCICESANVIRKDWGLPERKLHLTLGNIKHLLNKGI